MPEPRRTPVLVLGALLAVVGAMVPAVQPGEGPGAGALTVSPSAALAAAAGALSSSWSCAGATNGATSALPGRLVFDNGGAKAVTGQVRLVDQDGESQAERVAVPPGGSAALPEIVSAAPTGSWVGAEVTLDGGMATVRQVVGSRWGSTSEPCASLTSGTWYFPFGMDLSNAGEYISLVNPYPVDAIVDLSFTTERGIEAPGAFEGIVVRARGLAVVSLAAHMARRDHIAATVHVRSGQVVAFETELVSPPAKDGQLLGTPGALNPLAPQAGLTLTLGQPQARPSLWWPAGQEGDGVSESYDIYNPGRRPAHATLDLLTQGTASGSQLAGTDAVSLAAHGWAQVTTNGKPWAIAGTTYVAHLQSDNGTALVAQRSVTVSAKRPQGGLGAVVGLAGPAEQWLLAGAEPGLDVQVSDPGATPATVRVNVRGPGGRLVPVSGVATTFLEAGQRTTLALPPSTDGRAVVLTTDEPVLVEDGPVSPAAPAQAKLAPAVAVAGPDGSP